MGSAVGAEVDPGAGVGDGLVCGLVDDGLVVEEPTGSDFGEHAAKSDKPTNGVSLTKRRREVN